MKRREGKASGGQGRPMFSDEYREVSYQFLDICLSLDEEAKVVHVNLEKVVEGRRFFRDLIARGEISDLTVTDIDDIAQRILALVDFPVADLPPGIEDKIRAVTRLRENRGSPGNSRRLAS